ncbi:MAG: phospho-N-acetylmuramoyl-pentapeptide-transferase [Deinococcota bacterium]
MRLLYAALLSFFLVGVFVKLAKRFGWGKAVRSDGPQSHLAKAGTPTMGGVAFLVAGILVWRLTTTPSSDEWALVGLIVLTAILGWYDDILSLRRKRLGQQDASTGLLARYRLPMQALCAILFAIYVVSTGRNLFGPNWLDVICYGFIIVGAINALNFSDGLDGLAAGMSAIMLLLFIQVPLVICLVGALCGFLWHNAKPAKVFMGGVGSESLGAALAGTAILADATWWLPLIAFVPVVEVLSVIAQVLYFRATAGKRLLRMSPIHHHFELIGWSETQVVMRFWLVTALCVGLTWHWRGGF